MKMSFLYFEYKNIRKFKDLKISFVDQNNNVIKNTFLMMGNGTGKTTSMSLIKGLLDGSAEKWDSDRVKSFAPINRTKNGGSFSIAIKFDERKYIYKLNLNYEEGKAYIETTALPKGKEKGLILPEALNGVFSPEFVRRFVFDGEQAAKSLDSTSNEAEETIKYLYRLDKLDEILALNQRILQDIQSAEGGKRGTDSSIKNLNSRKEKIEKALAELIIKQAELRKEEQELTDSLKVKDKQKADLDGKNKELNNEKVEIEKLQKENAGKIDVKISEILSILKSPARVSKKLCDDMLLLGNSMKKRKLPKSISKDFFKELADAPKCVCGRCIGENEKEQILKNAEQYLGSDQQAVLNEIKSSLMASEYDEALVNAYAELKELLEERKKLEQRHLTNAEKLLKAGGKNAQELQDSIKDLSEKIGVVRSRLATIESNDELDDSLTSLNNIAKAEKEISEYEGQIASATRTHIALERKNIVEEIIQKIKNAATNALKEEILRKTNEKLSLVIKDDVIEVENIDKYIKLKGKSGASEGQTLSIAYCFLGTLFEDSELEFPFVIDSPCGSMDLSKRKAIADIVPDVFNQLIAFVTSAEVDQFANQFYDNSNAQFITIIASVDSDEIEYHEGKEFFDSYQRTHKEEE